MAEEGIIVHRHLAIQAHQLALAHDRQGIDLSQGGIALHERGVKRLGNADEIADQFAIDAHRHRHLARLVVFEAEEGINGNLGDLLRGLSRHLFDVYAALTGTHHHHAALRAINDQA